MGSWHKIDSNLTGKAPFVRATKAKGRARRCPELVERLLPSRRMVGRGPTLHLHMEGEL